jgi:hypothetical protein
MPVKKVLNVLKNKVKKSSFGGRDKMDKALEEFDDYINLGIKPKPLQGPDLKPKSKTKELRKPIDMSVEERTSGLLKEGKDYKIGPEGEYISLKDEIPEKFAKGGLIKRGFPKLAKKGWK